MIKDDLLHPVDFRPTELAPHFETLVPVGHLHLRVAEFVVVVELHFHVVDQHLVGFHQQSVFGLGLLQVGRPFQIHRNRILSAAVHPEGKGGRDRPKFIGIDDFRGAHGDP